MSKTKVTRVALQQPALPRFRHPLFLALSEQDDLELEVVYESEPGNRNVDPGALNARIDDPLRMKTPAGPVIWAGSQWRFAHKDACDVLIMTWNTRYLSLVPALLRARRRGVATILWGHGYSKRDSRVRLWLRRAVTRLATAVMFYDAQSASDFIDSGGSSAATFVAVNAIDQEPIQRARIAWEDPERLQIFKSEKGLDPGPTIAFVSRLNPSRRLDLLIEAIGSLRSDYPYLNLIMIGEGAEEQQRIEQQAAGMGVSDAIHFVGPVFAEAELAPWILSADIVSLPSAVGVSVLTAFGFGRAVVANNDPALNGPEWTAIRHGENGLHYEAGDATSLAEVLHQVLRDEELRDRLNRGALRTAQQDYALDTMIQGINRAIDYCRSA